MRTFSQLLPDDVRSVLTPSIRRFYLCSLLYCVGLGLTFSLFVVYLHNVRGYSAGFATLLLALSAVAGLVTSPLWGSATDRFGPVRVIVVAYLCDAGALVLWAFAHSRTQLFLVTVLLAIFGGSGWGPSSTLLGRLVTDETRQRAFGYNFMLVNLGIGLGGLLSAFVVDLHHPVSFELLYLANAAVCVFTAGLYLTLARVGGPVREHHDDPVKSAEGWREVLRDRRLTLYITASLVLMIGGYGSQEAGYSLFIVNNLKLSVHVIGVSLFFNTSTIVLAQVFVLRRIEHRSRTRVLAAVGALWFLFWMLLDLALALPPALAIVTLCVSASIFAIGETMNSPVGPAIVNELAPDHLRGRYNAANGLTWGLSGTVAPAIAAFYFDRGIGAWWPASVALASLGGGALMLRLRGRLSDAEDGREPVQLEV